ncbi:MAG TPA: efflux RND transporter periplasmic adaptor subunit [Candidatus Polarisedimenticolaceae bacterium]|nr:efflux RND transporter periplasmic adaptor subunit [Candidatus Polarisedimenticolaceae bacterium]
MQRAVLVLAVVLTLAGCNRERRTGDLVAAGHVEATEVRLSPLLGGKLVSFPVMEGDTIAAGQEIARIDPTDIELALAQARAERAGAAAQLALRRAGARREEIAEAEAQVEAARAALDAADKELRRLQDLLAQGVVSAQMRDEALGRRDVAAGQLQAASQRLAALRAGFRREEVEASRAQVAAADARIAQLEKSARDTVVVSRVSGVLTEKVSQEGETVSPGETLAVVADLGNAWLNVYVGEPDLGKLRLGQTVTVVTDDGAQRPGKITFIASEAEFTPKNVQTRDERVKLVYRVKVGLQNQDGFYKPGMPAEARLRA